MWLPCRIEKMLSFKETASPSGSYNPLIPSSKLFPEEHRHCAVLRIEEKGPWRGEKVGHRSHEKEMGKAKGREIFTGRRLQQHHTRGGAGKEAKVTLKMLIKATGSHMFHVYFKITS